MRPGALGDVILTFPALDRIRSINSGAKITIAANPLYAQAALEFRLVDEILSFEGRELRPLFIGQTANIHFDEAYVWMKDVDDLFVQSLRKICPVYASPSIQSHPFVHQSEFLFRIHGADVSASEIARVWASLPGRLPIRSEEFDVCIHPGSAGIHKRWALERFRAVRDSLVQRGRRVSWILGPAENELLESGIAMSGSEDTIFRSPSIRELIGILSSCKVFLGNDSGVSHLAAAAGAPCVVIFGPTDPCIWAPRGNVQILHTLDASVQDVLDLLKSARRH